MALAVSAVIGIAYVSAQGAARRRQEMESARSATADENLGVPGAARRAASDKEQADQNQNREQDRQAVFEDIAEK